MAISPDYVTFAVITRELSTVNSQYIYRLEIYSFNQLNKL